MYQNAGRKESNNKEDDNYYNEDLYKKDYSSNQQSNINNNQNIPNIDTKHEIIMNNIFGNNNPNKTSDYPKFGNIKNYVYDKGIQEVNHKINVTNYPMYNATANNNYDSYPTPEEYLKLMKQTGQKNYLAFQLNQWV